MSSRIQTPGGPSHDRLDSFESAEEFELDDADFESRGLTTDSYVRKPNSLWSQSVSRFLPVRWKRLLGRRPRRHLAKKSFLGKPSYYWSWVGRFKFLLKSIPGLVLILVLVTAIFWPSYNKPPAHYGVLRKRIEANDGSGLANADDQKIFIAASLYDQDGHLLDGTWGTSLLYLIDLLGPKNVYLSIYENGGPKAEAALDRFRNREDLMCRHSLVYEEHLPTTDIPRITLPDGSNRTKRIAYLAEARNRALEPLNEESHITYDKVLFLNDVFFKPIDAAQLLFSTNADENGQASYKAACAVDFINPFKFYDTFATRDLEGYSMGVPFFPWYSSAGQGFSRQDVLNGKDAVRVKSCWGGMVAFDARFFQSPGLPPHGFDVSSEGSSESILKPIRFRATPDIGWEASECCLIHADVLSASWNTSTQNDSGIYQNPFVRVAYGPRTLEWLATTQRIERLYSIPHNLINHLVGLPWHNPRRVETWNDEVQKTTGAVDRSTGVEAEDFDGDGYCGMRTLQLMREYPRKGEKNWETVPIP